MAITHDDRNMIAAESTLWSVCTLLQDIGEAGSWTSKVRELHARASDLAKELRDYNDQFEEND